MEPSYQLSSTTARLFADPKLVLKYQLGAENNLALNYNYRKEFGSIEDIYRGYILTDYRSLQANNASLTERNVHDLTLGFNYRESVQLLFFSVFLNYTHTEANNINYSVISNSFDQQITLPYNNGTNQYLINARVSKYLFGIHSTISAGAAYQAMQFNQIENKVLLPYTTISPSSFLSINTKITNQFNFEYKGTLNYIKGSSTTENSNTNITQFQQQLALNYSPFPKLFIAGSSDYHHSVQSNIAPFNYNFIDGFIKYKLTKSHIDVELDANNLLNIKRYNMVSLASNTYESSMYALPGRIVLCKLTFNL